MEQTDDVTKQLLLELRPCTKDHMWLYITGQVKYVDYFKYIAYRVGNTSGKLSIPVTRYSIGDNTMAGRGSRLDVWFEFGGHQYHGVKIGSNSDCVRVTRLKDKKK
jgi:hypothetical protein